MACFALPVARADYAGDLARIHVEAIGGRERVAGLRTMRATGHVRVGGRVLRFELIAQRPNCVRITTTGDGRTRVRATDGITAPWRLDPEKSPVPHQMSGEEAVEFLADAEFDDQLVNPAGRGYQLDFAGETTFEGHRALKRLVTHRAEKPYYLLLDGDTYFIVGRLTTRLLPSGRQVTVETRYGDFMPVDGILLARRIGIYTEGRLLDETVLETLTANQPVDEAIFRMPVAEGGAGR